MPLRLGTRASTLARWQADWVARQLREQGVDVELVPISTTGDRQQESVQSIGSPGIFTKEIQRALLDNRIDLAVHSLKDLPTVPTPSAPPGRLSGASGEALLGLCLAAVPPRGPVADVLITHKGVGSLFLPSQDNNTKPICVGTGSLRRRAQLLHVRADLQMKDIRGNVETRLRKLQQGDFDAIVLAEAGLRRLGLDSQIGEVLPLSIMLPAVGQGALALETRADDEPTRAVVSALDHPPTHAAVLAERAMLSALKGGCLAPIAALGQVDGHRLILTGRVLSHDGHRRLDATAEVQLPLACFSGTGEEMSESAVVASTAEEVGRRVAYTLLAQGAAELINAARNDAPSSW